jgi:predicted metal-dependent hydrolase
MGFTEEETFNKTKALNDLEDVISKAIKKVGGRKENDLCKYLPMSSGGYMHHFTLKKMKYKQPSELSTLIKKFIIATEKPAVIPPKQRAARGSRKRKDHLNFTKTQLERLLNMARLAGDKEMIAILSPKKSLATCKRELIQSIRHEIVNQDLWNAYVESIHAQEARSTLEQNMANLQRN